MLFFRSRPKTIDLWFFLFEMNLKKLLMTNLFIIITKKSREGKIIIRDLGAYILLSTMIKKPKMRKKVIKKFMYNLKEYATKNLKY